jgi:peptidoglycan/LPS O-acetylase OafA/YrhL
VQQWLLPLATAATATITWIAWTKGTFDFDNPLTETIGASALAVLFACVVFYAVAGQGGAARSLLQTSWLRAAGRYSYAVYVFHVTPHFILLKSAEILIARQSHILQTVLRCSYVGAMFAISFGAGWVSWRVLEQPLLKLKDRLPVLGSGKPVLLEG